MITNYLTYIKENNTESILVIVDVQKEFEKYIPKSYVENLITYSANFNKVYQIWDSNDAKEPSYIFNNQKDAIIKKFGTKFSDDLEQTVKELNAKYPNAKEGDIFKFDDINSYVVKITNKHSWFYIPERMADLFKKLKGKEVTLVGGAGATDKNFYNIQDGNIKFDNGECIKDVYEAMLAFGINVKYDTRYIYNAKTNNNQKHIKN